MKSQIVILFCILTYSCIMDLPRQLQYLVEQTLRLLGEHILPG